MDHGLMKIKAKTIDEYLEKLPADRRDALQKVRQIILQNLPEGYSEVLQYGMLSYVIPLETFANTYNKKPLAYISLGNQKNWFKEC